MKTHSILSKEFFSTVHRLSIHKITALLVLILCIGISPAWGAKPGAILYVNASAAADGDGTSWDKAFTDLQSAIDAAVSGDEIWVAAGTYKPSTRIDGSSDPRAASFILKSGVKIYGSFAGDEKQLAKRQLDPSLTVLSGDIGTPGDDTDNSYHVVYANGVTEAVFDGFTVTGGRGDGQSYASGRANKGAGMYNYNSALTVANCTFSDNKVGVITLYSGSAGAGMYNENSAPIVTNCTFIANIAGNSSNRTYGRGGGMYNQGSFDTAGERWPIITHCTFRENVAHYSSLETQIDGGGGMYNYLSSPLLIVDSCIFEGNSARKRGGGMLNFGSPTIRNCIFNANFTIGGHGGAIYNLGSPAILNCTFYKNGWRLMPPWGLIPDTLQGGAIFDERVSSTITNCIFSENASRGYGGAVASGAMRLPWTTLTNCLFYDNISSGGEHDPAYWVINHVYWHVDVVNPLYDIDPLLVDPAGGDFHLRYDSPCIDAGYSLKRGYLPDHLYPTGLPTTDFEGDKRIVEGGGYGPPTVDIGVDEFMPNLPDLRAFLQSLADSGELDEATAARLIAYVDEALAASNRNAATTILNELIADAEASLGGTETGQVIVQKTEVVIESLD